jgi:hypothetical protein
MKTLSTAPISERRKPVTEVSRSVEMLPRTGGHTGAIDCCYPISQCFLTLEER